MIRVAPFVGGVESKNWKIENGNSKLGKTEGCGGQCLYRLAIGDILKMNQLAGLFGYLGVY